MYWRIDGDGWLKKLGGARQATERCSETVCHNGEGSPCLCKQTTINWALIRIYRREKCLLPFLWWRNPGRWRQEIQVGKKRRRKKNISIISIIKCISHCYRFTLCLYRVHQDNVVNISTISASVLLVLICLPVFPIQESSMTWMDLESSYLSTKWGHARCAHSQMNFMRPRLAQEAPPLKCLHNWVWSSLNLYTTTILTLISFLVPGYLSQLLLKIMWILSCICNIRSYKAY